MQIVWNFRNIKIVINERRCTMYYNLTNPDASYYWLHEVLQIKQGELIESYVIECHNDFDTFYNKYRVLIDKLDVENKERYAGCNDVLLLESFDRGKGP